MTSDAKCKKCRRAGEKLYLKGEKCFTPKCPFVERPYPPGIRDSERKHRTNKSEYSEQLKEKQKIRNIYGLSEKQFANYVENIKPLSVKHKTNEGQALIMQLEERLDNSVFRMGLATSRALARQLVSHGHIVVNGKKVDVPSLRVTVGDEIDVREGSRTIKVFTSIADKLKDHKLVSWMTVDPVKMSAKITAHPFETDHALDIQKVLEFYSR